MTDLSRSTSSARVLFAALASPLLWPLAAAAQDNTVLTLGTVHSNADAGRETSARTIFSFRGCDRR